MKNILLPCLAAAALTLSFCFEQAPDASASASAPRVPAAAEASLLSGLTSGGPVAPALPAVPEPAATTASRDSLAYGYYSQTLGVKLQHTEDKGLLQTITDWLGTPYSYGASSRRGTDCSGFVSRVFKSVYGITLKRSSRSMFSTVKRVARHDMKAGDLVFFSHGKGNIYHVGIYLNNNKFAHAACNGGVMVSSLNEPYYSHNFYAGGRVAGVSATPAAAPSSPLVTAEMLSAVSRLRPE